MLYQLSYLATPWSKNTRAGVFNYTKPDLGS